MLQGLDLAARGGSATPGGTDALGPITALAAACLGVLLISAGCGAHVARSGPPALPERVGAFSVAWVRGKGDLPRTQDQMAVGDAVFTIGAGAAHPITARLPDGGQSRPTAAPCPALPVWQVGLVGWAPAMLCLRSGALELFLFQSNGAAQPLGLAAGDILPGAPPVRLDFRSLGGYALSDGVAWWLRGTRGRVVASGVESTLTANRAALPQAVLPASGGVRLLSVTGQLYLLRRVPGALMVYRLVLGDPVRLRPQIEPLGQVPAAHAWAVDASGGIWATTLAGPDRLVLLREVPGRSVRQAWRVRGRLIGAGPGFIAYLDDRGQEANLQILFPLQHRTLTLGGLRRPFAAMQVAGDGSAYLRLQLTTGRHVLRIAWSPSP